MKILLFIIGIILVIIALLLYCQCNYEKFTYVKYPNSEIYNNSKLINSEMKNDYKCSGVKLFEPIPFVPYSPEPFASVTDVISASQFIENAVHGKNRNDVIYNLNTAINWLCHALTYFNAAIQSNINNIEDFKHLAGNIQFAINKLKYLSDNVPDDKNKIDFSNYLLNNIYFYQGYTSYLYKNMLKLL